MNNVDNVHVLFAKSLPMTQTGKRKRQGRKTCSRPPTIKQIFDRIEHSDLAIKKLFLGETLTDDELYYLMKSDYLEPLDDGQDTENCNKTRTLYDSAKFSLAIATPFLFQNIEIEVLAYFGRHPQLLYSLPPRKFEELIASVFRNNGFEVELTPETRDGGFDVIASQKNGFAGSTMHLIECKRYTPENKVGIGIVQRMLGVIEQHRATQGIIVTTSSFSRDAEICAESSRNRLGLKQYCDISKWLAAF